MTIRAFGLAGKHIETCFQLIDDSQRPAYLLGIVQNWLIMVLDLVTMAIAAMLSSLAVTLRSGTGFTGASLVTLMSFGDQLTQIIIFLTLLETSLGKLCSMRMTYSSADKRQAQSRGCEILVPMSYRRKRPTRYTSPN